MLSVFSLPFVLSLTYYAFSSAMYKVNIEVYIIVSTNRYPGGPLLNPLGLAKDIKNARESKLKEIKNGTIFFSVLYSL